MKQLTGLDATFLHLENASQFGHVSGLSIFSRPDAPGYDPYNAWRAQLSERLDRVTVEGNRQFNPGWHLALDLHSMFTVAMACARSALIRKESRGGHTRDDHPYTDDSWGKINVVIRQRQGALALSREPLSEMPAELRALFQERK